MKRSAVLLVVLLASCGQTMSDGVDPSAGSGGAAGAQGGDALSGAGEAGSTRAGSADAEEAGAAGALNEHLLVLPAICDKDITAPPDNLVCSGLYADIASKEIAWGVEAYAPAIPLWSDGAEKKRWISLPAGSVIDNSDPQEWLFPIGTRVWKEFSVSGQRIETRLWEKLDTDYWVAAAYRWNADESAAVRTAGGDIALPSRTYHIPTSDECKQCHKGRTDRILGFEQGLLGLAGATGLTLAELVATQRLSNPPKSTSLTIGDDGTGLAAPALGWLHVNCGTTCHNRNSNASAWSTGEFFRLDPTQLDGRPVTGFDPLLTTIDQKAVSANWKGQTRIAPGDPANSLLYSLISHRGTGKQMPPIATNLVDTADIALVEAWIAALPKPVGEGGTGGVSFGGAGNGGSAGTITSAGAGNGGTANGGTANGGTANGGTANGGTANGGTANGGTANGGTGVAGTPNGGSNTAGGSDNGGSGNGGSGNGGSDNGGAGNASGAPSDTGGGGSDGSTLPDAGPPDASDDGSVDAGTDDSDPDAAAGATSNP